MFVITKRPYHKEQNQSSSTQSSKVISKVKVFINKVDLQGKWSCHTKISREISKTLALTVQKLFAKLKFQIDNLQNDRHEKNNMPPIFDLGGHKNRRYGGCKYVSIVLTLVR